MKSYNVRALTEGAVFASLTALLGIIMTYVPFLQILAYIWATPLVIVSYRNGFKLGIISAIVASVVISIFTTPTNGLLLVLMLGLPGVVMGLCLKKKVNSHVVILISGGVMALALLLGIIASMLMFTPMANQSFDDLNKTFNEVIDQVEDTYKVFGVNEENIDLVIRNLRDTFKMLKLLFPYIMVTAGVMFAFVNFKFTRLVLSRAGYEIENIRKFSMWRIPNKLVIPITITLLAVLMLKINKVEFALILTENLFMIIMLIFTVVGLSLLTYYIDIFASKYEIPKALKIILVIIFAIALRQMLVMITMVNIAFNLRLIPKRD